MPRAGVVAVLAGTAGDRERARATVIRPFGRAAVEPEVFADGPLTVAWAPDGDRAVHVSDPLVCLIDGVIYGRDRLERAAGAVGGGAGGGGRANVAELLGIAYHRRGEAALRELRGDFWALLWDRSRRRGLAFGDQTGCRAPFWTRSGGDLLIGSEVSELLEALPRRPEPDAVALAHWLSMTVPPDGRTLFAGIRRLPAGHCLPLGDRAGGPRRYWSPVYRAPLQAPREELVERVRASLSQAVARRLPEGQQAGMLLSGGLDSSAVAAHAAALKPRLPAYSATFPTLPGIDESHLVDLVVGRLGLPSTRIVVRGGSVLAGALEFISDWRLPPTSPNLFFWSPLFERMAADGVQVILDGEGGDGVFGLAPYLIADLLRRGQVGAAAEMARRFPSPGRLRGTIVWARLKTYGLRALMPPVAHLVMRRLRGADKYALPWLRPELQAQWLRSEQSPVAWKRLAGPRWWAYLVEWATLGPGLTLLYDQSRRRAAAAGVSDRHPLLDLDLIELMLQMPPELAFDRRYTRPLLRDTVAGMLPDEVRLRPAKSYFDSLFHKALAEVDLPVARKLLSEGNPALTPYVNLDIVRDKLLTSDAPRERHGRQQWAIELWRLVTAECWLRNEHDPSFLHDLAEREGLAPEGHELGSAA